MKGLTQFLVPTAAVRSIPAIVATAGLAWAPQAAEIAGGALRKGTGVQSREHCWQQSEEDSNMSFEAQRIPPGRGRRLADSGPLDGMNEGPKPKVSEVVHQPRDTYECYFSVLCTAIKYTSYGSSLHESKWFLHGM